MTIYDLISAQAQRRPDAVAIDGDGRSPLTYRKLLAQIGLTVKSLNDFGVGRNERVAIVLPNGPQMAVAFLSVAAGATSAPLNPAYREKEFDFYLSDLNARALIIQSGMDSPARIVAGAHGIPIIDLVPDEEIAGLFTLTACQHDGIAPSFAQEEDIALVLHTSGTTSRPKIVPLTHSNICTSALSIRDSFQLGENDRCLNVMPLFHIHGLIGAVLSSLAAGAGVVCTPGFYAPKFFGWIEEYRPSWYTAVPTMHQSILARAQDDGYDSVRAPLRFVRSCSSALPPQVMRALEDLFHAPAVESYGMTEASHQMSSNPLPPRERKPGSVGVAAGPEVAIMDSQGTLLQPAETGEIVIRGSNVTKGYENNPQANETSFTNSWFRTGDQGYLDNEGYLFITGRIKEIINRAGENISPREIDEALMDHPAVAQAVTFALPDPRLGEDVAAAVVLRDGFDASEQEIREFAAERLVDFKVPRRVLILDEIPKGPTGKLQRIGMAEKLGLTGVVEPTAEVKPAFTAPRTDVEKELAAVWAEILGVETIGVHDDFFELGGDSVLATLLVTRLLDSMDAELSLVSFLDHPTVAAVARSIEESERTRKDGPASQALLVAIQPGGSKPPLFCVHEINGSLTGYCSLVPYLGPDQPLYGLPSPSVDKRPEPYTLEELAKWHLREMRTLQPEGPYYLAGTCFGGVVAFEMARQLDAEHQKVALLAMFDCYNNAWTTSLAKTTLLGHRLAHFMRRTRFHLANLWNIGFRKSVPYLAARLKAFAEAFGEARKQSRYRRHLRTGASLPPALKDTSYANRQARDEYVPQAYSGQAVMFRVSGPRAGVYPAPQMGWDGLFEEGLEIYEVPSEHATMFQEPYIQILGSRLRNSLETASTKSDSFNASPA